MRGSPTHFARRSAHEVVVSAGSARPLEDAHDLAMQPRRERALLHDAARERPDLVSPPAGTPMISFSAWLRMTVAPERLQDACTTQPTICVSGRAAAMSTYQNGPHACNTNRDFTTPNTAGLMRSVLAMKTDQRNRAG